MPFGARQTYESCLSIVRSHGRGVFNAIRKVFPMLSSDYPIVNRRHFLRHVAGASVVALSGRQFIENIAAAAPALKKDNKSLIVLWMSGGPPSIDIWDLKPGEQTGGEFKPIKTSASGVEISEHMPLVA